METKGVLHKNNFFTKFCKCKWCIQSQPIIKPNDYFISSDKK